jgi:hypothetical protein
MKDSILHTYLIPEQHVYELINGDFPDLILDIHTIVEPVLKPTYITPGLFASGYFLSRCTVYGLEDDQDYVVPVGEASVAIRLPSRFVSWLSRLLVKEDERFVSLNLVNIPSQTQDDETFKQACVWNHYLDRAFFTAYSLRLPDQMDSADNS